jgi:hypothetical protein
MRIANAKRSVVGVLITVAAVLVAAAEPLAAWAGQGSPGGF